VSTPRELSRSCLGDEVELCRSSDIDNAEQSLNVQRTPQNAPLREHGHVVMDRTRADVLRFANDSQGSPPAALPRAKLATGTLRALHGLRQQLMPSMTRPEIELVMRC
jgi:hypothetical protein